MNDRYLFRAWHKELSEMWYMDNRYHSSLIVSKIDNQDNELIPLELMQCTGLKDVNGNLIYDGDIVKDPNPDNADDTTICLVKYDVENGRYYLYAFESGLIGDIENGLDDLYGISDFETNENLSLIVIGNVHDNPELMEVMG